MNELPYVDRILGSELLHDQQDKPERVNIQFQDKSRNLHKLSMGFGDAMYLLSMLKAMQLDTKTPFPDDPRPPSHRR